MVLVSILNSIATGMASQRGWQLLPTGCSGCDCQYPAKAIMSYLSFVSPRALFTSVLAG